MRAIISKELRELIRLLPVGLVLIGFAVWYSLPTYSGWQETGLIPTCAALFAVLLAAMQGFFDLSDRQSGFLFHRSLSRAKIMYGKVLAALIVYLIAVAIPLTCMAFYFARIGLEYQPVDPIQILPTLVLCIAGFVMHPTALLTIDREANWFGTRLIPLTVAIFSLFVLSITLLVPTPVFAVVLNCTVFAIVCGLLLLALQRGHLARKIVVGGGALSLVLAVIIFAATLLESATRQAAPFATEYGMDKQGDLWVYHSRFDYSENGYVSIRVPVSGDRLQSERPPNLSGPLPKGFAPLGLASLGRLEDGSRPQRYQYSGSSGRKMFVTAPGGIVLIYDSSATPPLQGAVARSGFHTSVDAIDEPFNGDALIYGSSASGVLTSAGYEALWVDRDGVYQFDRERGLVTALVELPIESAAVLLSGDPESTESTIVRLYVQTGTEAYLFKLIDSAGESNWFVNDRESRSRALPQLQAVKERTLPKLPKEMSDIYTVLGMTPDGGLVAVAAYWNFKRAVIAATPDADWKLDQIVAPNLGVQPSVASAGMLSLIPPGVMLVFSVFAWVYSSVNDLPRPTLVGLPDNSLPLLLSIGLLATLVSIALVWVLGRRRGFSTSTNLAWSMGTLLAGLAGPLILIALHPRVQCEPCTRCERLRRIDRGTCPHCGNGWEPIESEGIEIIDFEVRGDGARRVGSREGLTL